MQPVTPTTRITIRLSPADYAFASRHMALLLGREGRWYWPIRLIGVAIGFLAILGFLGLFTFEVRHAPLATAAVRHSALMLVAAFALIPIAGLLRKRSAASVLYKPDSPLLQPYELSVTDSGLSIESTSGSLFLPWRGVGRVDIQGDLLFLYSQPNHALLVPAHAFSGRSEFDAFVAHVAALKSRNATESS